MSMWSSFKIGDMDVLISKCVYRNLENQDSKTGDSKSRIQKVASRKLEIENYPASIVNRIEFFRKAIEESQQEFIQKLMDHARDQAMKAKPLLVK